MRLLCEVYPYVTKNEHIKEILIELDSLQTSLIANIDYVRRKEGEIEELVDDIEYVKSLYMGESKGEAPEGMDLLYAGRLEYLMGLGYDYKHVRSIRTLETIVREVMDETWVKIEEETKRYLDMVNTVRSRMIVSSLGSGIEYINGSKYNIKTYDGYYGFEAKIRTSWREVPVYILWDLSRGETFSRLPAGEVLKKSELERYIEKLERRGKTPSSLVVEFYNKYMSDCEEYVLERDLDLPSFSTAVNMIGTTGSGTQNIYIEGVNITDLGSLDYLKVKSNVLKLELEQESKEIA